MSIAEYPKPRRDDSCVEELHGQKVGMTFYMFGSMSIGPQVSCPACPALYKLWNSPVEL